MLTVGAGVAGGVGADRGAPHAQCCISVETGKPREIPAFVQANWRSPLSGGVWCTVEVVETHRFIR